MNQLLVSLEPRVVNEVYCLLLYNMSKSNPRLPSVLATVAPSGMCVSHETMTSSPMYLRNSSSSNSSSTCGTRNHISGPGTLYSTLVIKQNVQYIHIRL